MPLAPHSPHRSFSLLSPLSPSSPERPIVPLPIIPTFRSSSPFPSFPPPFSPYTLFLPIKSVFFPPYPPISPPPILPYQSFWHNKSDQTNNDIETVLFPYLLKKMYKSFSFRLLFTFFSSSLSPASIFPFFLLVFHLFFTCVLYLVLILCHSFFLNTFLSFSLYALFLFLSPSF